MGLEKVTELHVGDIVKTTERLFDQSTSCTGLNRSFPVKKGTVGKVIQVHPARCYVAIEYNVAEVKKILLIYEPAGLLGNTLDKLSVVKCAAEVDQYKTALTSVAALSKGDKVVFIDDFVAPKMGSWDCGRIDKDSEGIVVGKYTKPPCVGLEVLAGYGTKTKRLVIAYDEASDDLRAPSENCRQYIAKV